MTRKSLTDAPAHRAVLADQAVRYLVTEPDGTYLDATFGRGGHSGLVLQALGPRGRLIALDRDPQAVEAAASISDPRFHIEHTAFSRLEQILAVAGVGALNGVLFDIGISSPQIDTAARGFSWRNDAPLDMRMDTTRGATAAEWLGRTSIDELTKVIRDYGEERFAAQIAKAIVARRESGAADCHHRRTCRARGSRDSRAGAARTGHSIRPLGRFRLYGFTSIKSLRNWR